MEAKELRIGNYVDCSKKRHNEKFIEVESIFFDCINYDFRKYDICDLIPILLTEEWLFKFGFECIANSGDQKRFGLKNRNKNYFYGVELDHEEICLNKQSLLGCETIIHNEIFLQYVHQLQNLYFSLIGEELTIK